MKQSREIVEEFLEKIQFFLMNHGILVSTTEIVVYLMLFILFIWGLILCK